MNEHVVIVTPTVQDGTVACWYRDVAAAERDDASVSASQSRVSIHDDDFQELPPEWVALALDVYRQLSRDRNANVGHMATHRRNGRTLERISGVMP